MDAILQLNYEKEKYYLSVSPDLLQEVNSSDSLADSNSSVPPFRAHKEGGLGNGGPSE